MASTLRIKRRVSGAAGAPSALKTAELAWNMADGKVYGGKGDDASGNATSVVPLFGEGFVENLPARGTALQVLRVNAAGSGLEYATIAAGNIYTNGIGLTLTALQFAVDFTVVAPLASPAFTGTPTAPTQAVGDNSTKVATTAFVTSKINNLIGGATAAYDTFAELQALMQADDTETANIITSLGGKLQKDQNLSDLTNAATARMNLGLGTMATQAANNVAITGGIIDGIVLDGGTF